jgi:cell volume regulation protein A
MPVEDVIQSVALILAAGLASQLLATALRLPSMVVLLACGALIGPHVLGWLDAPLDAVGPQTLLTLGVSLILFHGGLGLSVRVLRGVAVGLGLLALPGVVLTGLVTGAVATAAFGLGFDQGLLIGVVLAPTDPAILIPLLEQIRVRPKVVQTVIAESGFNDPIGAVLAFILAATVLEGGGSFSEPLVEFVTDLGISTGLGLVFGLLLAATISTRRYGVWRETPGLAVLMIVTASVFSIDSAGGSGLLGAFLAGIVAGNMDDLGLAMHPEHETNLRRFTEIVADVVVIFIFVVVGANIPFDAFPDYALPGLATLAALIVVARPLTVIACLGLDRRGCWSREEMTFVAWTRETGVVPAALAGILAAEGIPHKDELVTTVALAIVVTLLVQSTTKAWLARRLDLLEPTPSWEQTAAERTAS